MPKAGGKRKVVDPTDYENDVEPTVYELQRDENVRLRIQKMQELNIMPTTQELSAMHQTKNKKGMYSHESKMFSNNNTKCLWKSKIIIFPNLAPRS